MKRFPSSAAKVKRAQNRQKKNWLHVNIGAQEAKELRALAECYGCNLRSFLEQAVRFHTLEVGELLKLKPWEAVKILRRRRLAMARRNWEIWRAIRMPSDSFKN
jgi:hypothetical protein